MNDELSEDVRAAVGAILDGRDAHPGDFDRPLWTDLAETGFHLLGVPEEVGGSGGRLRDLAVVADLTAFHASRVPVAEAAFLAGWLLGRAGLAVPEGLVVASLDEARRTTGLRLSGCLRTPWARHADHVVTIARSGGERVVAVVPTGGGVERARNLAGEPRDTLVLDHVAAIAAAPADVDAERLRERGALARSVQLAGAARAVLESAGRHITERVQFGRPLARFQAVQQQLAALAAEATAMRLSADAAVLAVEADAADAGIAVAAAKAGCSAAAHTVAAIGHQLHGALGYSQEHRLGAATTRLWAWREEFGGEAHWQDRLAAAVSASGPWWPLLTGGAR
ncbi:acyl-CoA dehydrogenase family protein [Allonocardiopsis opalescens]|uniref:Acyl-CoA dehydrogenase n=1 Tax=Allonocardiopsis opalescens TaxID=1144618 RepID=A0A2T0Q7D0_9ACTN|nr:acyl-CoA dehydrogenase family protein [Allonocardiopsis opalescens]PRX99745.1 acyl-CoA dehydrogenase [Allonocardiopsis opalescens]